MGYFNHLYHKFLLFAMVSGSHFIVYMYNDFLVVI